MSEVSFRRLVPSADRESLQELLYQLFHSLLLYCFQEEQDGWRVWVETTAAIHAYVSLFMCKKIASKNFRKLCKSRKKIRNYCQSIREKYIRGFICPHIKNL